MGLFGRRKEERKKEEIEYQQKILKEIKSLRDDINTLFTRLNTTVETKNGEMQKYFYELLQSLEKISVLLATTNQDIKNLSKDLEVSVADIHSNIDAKSETQMKLLNQIMKRFTNLINIIGDILKHQLTSANDRIKRILSQNHLKDKDKDKKDLE